ncbi:MAG: L-aspartate oxidase [Actinomycetota bacterium]|nr:L-aspartate oxidase [Actinomycetota bacterium]
MTAPALSRPGVLTGPEPIVGSGHVVGVSPRLVAPAPVWQLRTDVLLVGSGVAALTLAAELAGSGLRVHLVTKGELGDGSTRWAQGGIARANTGPGFSTGSVAATDTPEDVERHVSDTLTAGAGLGDPRTVRQLATDGPGAVRRLADLGARFDLDADGRPALTREGGHSHARIVHAGGDATGAEVQRALQARLHTSLEADEITVAENAFLLDLLRGPDGAVRGAVVALLDATGSCRSVGIVHARATVLATGGLGQVFATTTNPAAVTGDGIAAALRAGAELADLEFVQFHPTVFAGAGPTDDGRHLLISEAVRGEGARIIDAGGVLVMAGAHPLADLAPRDVVSATMASAMAERGVRHLYLDARHLGEPVLDARFPTILARCRENGVDPLTQPIPVRPAAHYTCGGVRADLTGRTSLPGLFAIGEVACTGVHGANRLASNSLLEGLVAAHRLAGFLRGGGLPGSAARGRVTAPRDRAAGVLPGVRAGLALAMEDTAGVLRDPAGLDLLVRRLGEVPLADASEALPGRASWEATNLHTLMAAIAQAAVTRAESRGCHRRTDVDGVRSGWRRHLVATLADDGTGPATVRQEARP